MSRKYFVLFIIMLFSFILFIQNCQTESKIKPADSNSEKQNGLNESFSKTGWISENKYRAVIFVITEDECKNSSTAEIEQKIRFEAYKNLQKDLNPSFNRNASNQIKILADNFGKTIKLDKECINGILYFYDLEKNDLKSDFDKIKNLK